MSKTDFLKLVVTKSERPEIREILFTECENAYGNINASRDSGLYSITGFKLDYGSGAKPKEGYKTSDFTGLSNLDFFIEDYKINDLADNSCITIHCRNVIHHIPEHDLPILFGEFARLLRKGGTLILSEPMEKFHKQNLILDRIWYRFLVNNENIMLPMTYVDYKRYVNSDIFELQGEEEEIKNEILTYTRL